MQKKKVLLRLKECLYLIFGSLICAVGMNQFLVPAKLSAGGVGTIATILYHILNVPISITNLLGCGILFIFGYKLLGKDSVIKTALGILFLSAFLELTSYLPIYENDTFIATLAGGVLLGIGLGFIVRIDGSTGGSDFAALMLNRIFPHISVADFIMIIDCIIILIAGLIFKSITITVYSMASLIISSKVADYICCIGESAKSLFIISENSDEISQKILEEFERGVTGIKSVGMYSHEEKNMLMCVVIPKEAPKVAERVREIDHRAFIIISDVREVLGEGFKIENELVDKKSTCTK